MTHQNQLRAAGQHQKLGLIARQARPAAKDAEDDEKEDDEKVKGTVTTLTIGRNTIVVTLPPTSTRKPRPIPTRLIPTTSATLPKITVTRSIPTLSVPPIVRSTTTSATPTPPVTTTPVVTPSPATTATSLTAQTNTTNRDIANASANTLPSSTPTSVPSSGTSTGALVGGIGGGIVGVAALCFVLVFFIRRWRKKSADRDAFNATNFRKSALLLDEPPSDLHKPRPPTMIERRMASTPALPAPPAASYPYDDQPRHDNGYNASQYSGSHYGSDGSHSYGRDHYGAGVGAYGQHAPYAAYGAQPQHPPHPQYPQEHPQYFPQQYSFSPGEHIPAHRTSPPTTSPVHLPNPFAPAATSAAAAVAAARSAAAAPIPPPRNISQAEPQTGTFLSRQPTQAGGAPPAYLNEAKYANVQRDVKVAPMVVANASPTTPSSSSGNSAAPATTPDAGRRPLSTHTIYDPEDAYGGI